MHVRQPKTRQDRKDGASRVLRGGSFDYEGDRARCAFRGYNDPGFRDDHLGFRVCASLGR